VVLTKSRLDLKPAFSNILKCLSVFDILFLACLFWMYALQNFTSEEIFYQYMDPFLTPYILPLTQISLTGSVYSVIAVAVERYFNICKPFSRNLGSVCNGKIYIIIIILFSIALNFIKFFEYETGFTFDEDEETNTSLVIIHLSHTALRSNPAFATTSLVLQTLIMDHETTESQIEQSHHPCKEGPGHVSLVDWNSCCSDCLSHTKDYHQLL